ncbi:MAG: PQQ-binding-like beta-propeller repeat protein [Planctomycetota bacterium]|nr:PQQ-binding-like beta-propeller repeat protein [Planctomycetota bacterium]
MRVFATLALAWSLLGATLAAGETPLGWRNDGSGKFPHATPPAQWSRRSKAVAGLRTQVEKPAGPDAGKAAPMPGGTIHEWLVLGPVPVPEGVKPAEGDALPGETEFAPAEGDKAGDLAWKKAQFSSGVIDFQEALGKADKKAAYAFAHVYSEAKTVLRLQLTHHGSARVVVNGKQVYATNGPSGGRPKVELAQGWNRILIKVVGHDAWYAAPSFFGFQDGPYEQTNIAWSTPIAHSYTYFGASSGVGGPIVVKDRIYLLGELDSLYCVNKADGKILWIRPTGYFEAATDEDKKHAAWVEAAAAADLRAGLQADLLAGTLTQAKNEALQKAEKGVYDAMAKIDPARYKRSPVDVGNSGYTPVSDGERVYVWLPSGVTACYDLDGNRRWIRVDNIPSFEHGYSSSPVLADGKLIVFMRDLLAFDAKDGKLLWTTPVVDRKGNNPPGYFHGTPQPFEAGGAWHLMLGNGSVARVSDGKLVYQEKRSGNQSICSPVREGGDLYLVTTWSNQFFRYEAPKAAADPFVFASAEGVPLKGQAFPKFYLDWHMGSPVVHDGLAYLVNNNGVLTVVEAKTGALVYQRMLDLDSFQSHNESAARGSGVSPVLAGNHLYLFGNTGTCVVIEPGRTYKEVARNRLEGVAAKGTWGERQERFIANPWCDGKRIYVRGEENLYAIEAR